MIEVTTGNIFVENQTKKDGISNILKIPLVIKADNEVHSYGEIDLTEIGYFTQHVPSKLFDVLVFAGIVYSVDRLVSRKQYSINGLTREFKLSLPTSNTSTWVESKNLLEEMLSFMTGDLWYINFIQANEYKMPICHKEFDMSNVSSVTLFSGGMDSLIGAIDIAEITEGKTFLASHYDSTMGGPKGDQDRVFGMLDQSYPNRFLRFKSPVRIQPCRQKKSELSSRSRSLMFFAIASIVAESIGKPFYVPENGSVSLNYPLSPSRRSACSTRTTHPIMVHQFNKLMKSLGLKTLAINPYEFKTKGEMVQACKNKSILISIIPHSNSCGKRSQHQFMFDNNSATHCGRCMPCMYRKASMLNYKDSTSYGIKLTTLYASRKGKLSNDFFAMLNFLSKPLTREEIKDELLLQGMGILENLNQYVELVVRTRKELTNLVLAEGTQEIKNALL